MSWLAEKWLVNSFRTKSFRRRLLTPCRTSSTRRVRIGGTCSPDWRKSGQNSARPERPSVWQEWRVGWWVIGDEQGRGGVLVEVESSASTRTRLPSSPGANLEIPCGERRADRGSARKRGIHLLALARTSAAATLVSPRRRCSHTDQRT